jgi:4-amino-4-deoxy-L-arabinose transferase-like glycosyltransferase
VEITRPEPGATPPAAVSGMNAESTHAGMAAPEPAWRDRIASASSLWMVFVFLAAILPYAINLHRSALWDANEAFYAETPREMLESGDYLAPRFNYEPRAQKPPLTYWCVVAGYKLVGISELGVRLPGLFAAAGILLLAYETARQLFSRHAALLAVLMLGTTMRLFILARQLPRDILLVFWLTATAFFLTRALKHGQRKDWFFAYVAAGLGFLTKGPVAWALPGLSCGAWCLWTGRVRLRATHPFMGAAIQAALVAPWYLLTYFKYGWTYIGDFFLQDNFTRFTTGTLYGWSMSPSRSPFYYIHVFFVDFFPWSLLFTAGAIQLWSERKSLRTDNSLKFGFPLTWCAVVFLFFSISKSKQEYYIAPLYPLMAVLLAGLFEKPLFDPKSTSATGRRRCGATLAATAAVLGGVALFLPFVLPALIPEGPAVLHYAPTAFLLAAAGILAWNVRRGRLLQGVFTTALAMWFLFVSAATFYLPALEQLRPVKTICRTIQAYAGSGDEIGYYRAAVPSMLFYLRRQIFTVSDPPTMARIFQGDRRVFCVLGDDDYRSFTADGELRLYVLQRYPQLSTRLGDILFRRGTDADELLLVCNRPVTEAQSPEVGVNR